MTSQNFDLQKLNQIKHQLSELPHNQYWQIPVDGAEYLAEAVRRIQPKTILEIGTSSGYSALWIVEALINLNLAGQTNFYTIESNQSRHDFAQQNFENAGVTGLVTQIKGHAPQDIPQNTDYDLAFFDGTKSQTSDFFDAVWPILNLNGEILVDNVVSHSDKMQPFFDHLKNLGLDYEILDIGAGICRVVKLPTQ